MRRSMTAAVLATGTLAIGVLGPALAGGQTSDELSLKLRSSTIGKVLNTDRFKVLVTPNRNVREVNLIVGVLKLGTAKQWIRASNAGPTFEGKDAEVVRLRVNRAGRRSLRKWRRLGNPARIRILAKRDGEVIEKGFGRLE